MCNYDKNMTNIFPQIVLQTFGQNVWPVMLTSNRFVKRLAKAAMYTSIDQIFSVCQMFVICINI